MFWTIKVVIGDGERGLVYRDRRFQQILLPGVHRLSPFGGARTWTSTLHRRARPTPAATRTA